MAAVHYTTIPCELNTVCRHNESHILCEIRPWTNNIVYATFEVFRTFLCLFGFIDKCSSCHHFRYVDVISNLPINYTHLLTMFNLSWTRWADLAWIVANPSVIMPDKELSISEDDFLTLQTDVSVV